MLESYYGPKRAYDDVRNYSIPSQTTPKGAELCRAGINISLLNLPPSSAFSTPMPPSFTPLASQRLSPASPKP